MMTGFENSLQAASLALLKRELAEEERIEFLELAGAIGMSSVEDYLYMLMIFKRNEDRINGQLDFFEKKIKEKFDAMEVLENKIHDTLENSINRVLGDGAKKIGQDMVGFIASSAEDVLGANSDFHFQRGQLLIIGQMTFIALLAYLLGGINAFGHKESMNLFDVALRLPASGVALICVSTYTFVWFLDYQRYIRRFASYKITLVLQCLLILAILFRFLA